MSKRRLQDKKIQKEIAKNRINKLFQLAEKNSQMGKTNLANRYVQLARKISMRYLVPIPKKFKHCFCKHCYNYLSSNMCRTRIHRGKIIIFCNNCKKYTRIPLKSPSVILK